MAALLRLVLVLALLCLSLGGCAPRLQKHGVLISEPRLTGDVFWAADGKRLAVERWLPQQGTEARAVIVAAHGFNDYRKAFAIAAPDLAAAGIITIAYDQRGFGEDAQAGIWAGGDVMADDLRALVRAVKASYPELPLYVMGTSMGGAVVLVAMSGPEAPSGIVDGAILLAPAVWGWSTMNPFYKVALMLSAHVAPGWRVSGKNVDVHPSDNYDALVAMARDPLVIKKTRVDAVFGLVELMEDALDSAADVSVPVFVLYGRNDDIIKRKPIRRLRRNLPSNHVYRLYPNGFHMLLKDLCRASVIRDIRAFVLDSVQLEAASDVVGGDRRGRVSLTTAAKSDMPCARGGESSGEPPGQAEIGPTDTPAKNGDTGIGHPGSDPR